LSRAARLGCAVALAAALGLSGCIGGGERGGSARDGGSIRVGASAFPKTLDPALASAPDELQLLWLVHTPLLTYRRASGQDAMQVVPGLARALPKVSDDGLSYRLSLRPGLRYTNGAPVRPGDFERGIDRVRALHSPLAPLYSDIVSIDADASTGAIRIALAQPNPAFPNLLALPSSAPVPRGTPAKDLTRRPPPGIGPYRLARTRPRVELLRRRDFALAGLPAGHVDRIALSIPQPPARQAPAVVAGSLDVMQEPAPIDLLPEIRSKYRDRYREDPSASTVALVPDTDVPPLDGKSVRRAIAESLDAPTLARLYQGHLEPTCNLLPEAVRGYKRIDPCPYGDRDEPPDLAAAEEQIRASVAEGARISVTADPGVPAEVERNIVSTLRKIGLAASARRGGAPIRIERFAPVLGHPTAFLDPVAARVVDDDLAQSIRDGRFAQSGDDADKAWADADRRVVEQAYAMPLGTERRPTFLSDRLDAENCLRFQPLFGLDLSSLCLG
jgi:peptide/nickel transport system substrate-binding protein